MNNKKVTGFYISDCMRSEKAVKDEEIKEVVAAIQRGDKEAKEILLETMMRIIESQARVFAKTGIDMDDLIQEGIMGLFEAVEHFKTDSKNTFVTYATSWIISAMKKVCREQCGMIRIPASQRKVSLAIREIQNEAETQGRGVPSYKEISDRLKVKESAVVSAFLIIPTTVSLDETIDEEGELSRGDMLESQGPNAWDLMEKEAMASDIHKAMRKYLTADECEVLTLHYGLAGETYTEVKIAKMLGKSASRIWAIEKEAMRKIRAHAPELRLYL